MPLFQSRKRRISAPKRRSSRSHKKLPARTKNTIRKTLAAIAGMGGAAALTYAGLYLANQTNVKKCLEAKDIVEWRDLNCDKEMKSMLTNANTKKKMKSARSVLHGTAMGIVERSRTTPGAVQPFDINARDSDRFHKRSASQRKAQYDNSMNQFGSVVNQLQKKKKLKKVRSKSKHYRDAVTEKDRRQAGAVQNLRGLEELQKDDE